MDLATTLEMSESSVKRMMSAADGQFSKIEAICEAAGIELADLMSLAIQNQTDVVLLTEEQDEFFAKKTEYFYFFHLLQEEGLSVAQIKARYGINDRSLSKYLAKLEKLGLIERHAGDRIKLVKKGSINLPKMSKLGHYLLTKSLENLSDLMKSPRPLEETFQNGTSTFLMGEYPMREESAKLFGKKFYDIVKDLDRVSDHDSRVYEKDELVLYSHISGLLSKRLYYENLPDL